MEKLGIAGGELVVASEVNDDEATSLAEKISQQLKMEYPNLGIAITVKRDDQEITTVELD